MSRPPIDGWCNGSALYSVALTDGPIMGDNTELDDGCGVDRSSIGFFTDTAHSRLLWLFSDSQLVLDVIATRGHLLDSDILVGNAVFGSIARSCAGSTIVGF